MEYTITDMYSDDLRVDVSEENLYFGVDNDEGFEFDRDAAIQVRDAINEYLGESQADAFDTANEAKLQVAVTWGLRVKFAYQGNLDRKPVERRLKPDLLSETHVAGTAYDAGGQPEGYRQFRLDRISGEVVVR